MGSQRRNSIDTIDARWIAGVAAVSGIGAALAGCAPTGELAVDVLLCAGVGALITWLGASAPWWALLAGAALAVAGAVGGPLIWLVLAVAALVVAGRIGSQRANQPILRAVVAGAVVQVVFRLEFDPFFGASALVAAAGLAVIGGTGWWRRQGYVRRRVMWSTIGVLAAAVVAAATFGVVALQQRDAAVAGYRAMLDGLEAVQAGEVGAARAALFDAADRLDTAGDAFGGLAGQPARLVPGLAQNRTAAVELFGRAGDAALSAAQTLRSVDLDRLRIVDGVIDLEALEALEAPLDDLDRTVAELEQALVDADSPWLVAPLRERLDTSLARAEQASNQASALAATARLGPAMLGADGPRRYFLAFVNSAEARGHSGLMGNWSELVVDDGRMRVTRSGRTAELQRTLADDDVVIDERASYFRRFGAFGAGRTPDTGVFPNLWANVTMAPDMPTVGNVMAQLYEAHIGAPVDGVFVFDPTAMAALLAISGPIEIPELSEPLRASNAEEFLLFGQYEFEESEREDILDAVTEATIERVLGSTLPPPQELVQTLADPALHGHISGWAAREAEQELFSMVGMDAALPVLPSVDRPDGAAWTGDAIAVLTDNANPNKIDTFLRRDVTYTAVVDPETGSIEATVRVELTNDAPTSGLEDYVIGNRYGLPPGSNRTILTLLSPLDLVEYRLDGVVQQLGSIPDLGWNATPLFIEVLPGATVVVEADLTGLLAGATYELLVRPQPLPTPDELRVRVTEPDGTVIVAHDGPLLRRSVLDESGVRAWRPPTATTSRS